MYVCRKSWTRDTDFSLPILEIYKGLLEHYGPQRWWPADSPFEVMAGAVLVQSTSWRNVEHAIANLKASDSLSPDAIRDMGPETLEQLIRPSGFYRVKARRLRSLCEYLSERYADSIEAMNERPAGVLRRELLTVHGIGEETADDILLYAFNRPTFVVDAFTRRIFHRMGWCQLNSSYEDLQRVFHDHLPKDAALYNEYHALIVRHGNSTCRKMPNCDNCPLLSDCPRVGL